MDFLLFDADNHYYEAEDAFLRFGDERVRRHVRWMQDGKRRHLFFGRQQQWMIPNPTFNPVAKPGAFHEQLVALEKGNRPTGPMYGELEPIPEPYRDRSARLAVLDEQGVERVFLFPSLGLTTEGYMADNAELMYAVYRAFNEWVDDDWGHNYRERIYAPPHIPLLDVDLAVAELERVLDRGARIISLRPGPAYGRSPADPCFDPFWARIEEAGVAVGYHALGGPTAYTASFREMWVADPHLGDDPYYASFEAALHPLERPMMDTVMALVLGNLFGRFPKLRIASIEMGSVWVPYILHALDHAGGLITRKVNAFGQALDRRPSEIFKEHVWVAPFPEDDVVGLAELIGVDHVLMGSDFPHPEGNVRPTDFADGLQGLDATDVRRVMRDNALALIGA